MAQNALLGTFVSTCQQTLFAARLLAKRMKMPAPVVSLAGEGADPLYSFLLPWK